MDGWWAEAYTPEVVWALGDGREHGDDPAWDAVEADALYDLLNSAFQVNTYTTGEQSRPAVACWPGTSECVMTWRGEGPGDPNGIFGRHMSWGE